MHGLYSAFVNYLLQSVVFRHHLYFRQSELLAIYVNNLIKHYINLDLNLFLNRHTERQQIDKSR